MRYFTLIALFLIATTSFVLADDGCKEKPPTCAEVSLKILHYVDSNCKKIRTHAQDICAAATLQANRYISADCFKLTEFGGECVVASLDVKPYMDSLCFNLKNERQEKCAIASLKTLGYVTTDCLELLQSQKHSTRF